MDTQISASHSPLPKKKAVGKSFPEIIKEVIAGKKIYKAEWENKEFYGILKDGKLKLHKPDGEYYAWIISEGDLTGNDWETL